MGVVDVCVPVPEEALAAGGLDLEDAAETMRRLFLVDQVRRGHLSCGKAAQLAGMSQADFFSLLAEHQVSPFGLNEEELRHEMEPLR